MGETNLETITFPTSRGRHMRGWLGLPEKTGGRKKKMPAVLVIHEAVGLHPNIRPVVERFAAEGYVALAPDLFDKPDPTPVCVVKSMAAMMRGKGEAVEDLNAALEFLKRRDEVDRDRLAVAGFCMGGGFSLVMALNPDIKAAAPYYGNSRYFFDNVERSCPVVAGYGARDKAFGKVGRKLEKALYRAGVPHDVKTYEKAGHSYMTASLPGVMGAIGKATPLRVEYRPECAEDSWRRMLAFFAEHV